MAAAQEGREKKSGGKEGGGRDREQINDINISCSCHLGAKAFMYIHEREAS